MFKAAPGSLEAIEKEAKTMVVNDQPTVRAWRLVWGPVESAGAGMHASPRCMHAAQACTLRLGPAPPRLPRMRTAIERRPSARTACRPRYAGPAVRCAPTLLQGLACDSPRLTSPWLMPAISRPHPHALAAQAGENDQPVPAGENDVPPAIRDPENDDN